MSVQTAPLIFRDPHPLGLPSHTYSHHVRILGTGTFGEVYLCCRRTPQPLVVSGQTSAGQPADPLQDSGASLEWVAVKIYKKPVVQCDLPYLQYLKREAVNQRSLNHDHVIGFKEVGLTTQLRLYLTLEYADSGNLHQWLEKHGGRLPELSARWFAQQLVYGLAYCHAHGVVNRDIKPANLLLHSNRDGPHPLEQPLLKVADFGLCKSSTDSAPKSRVGSPHYMAPEVFSGKEYEGEKADVFSCGVVLYQMVFGTLPFNRTRDGAHLEFNRHFGEIRANMQKEMWPELLPSGISCSQGLMDLLSGMLRHDPNRRLKLEEVMRHDWYRGDLPEEAYRLVLSGGAGVDLRPPPASSQSVELIKAEFDRIMQHCAESHAAAARQMAGEELPLG